MRFQAIANAALRNGQGCWAGGKRIENYDFTPHTFSYGFTQPSLDATSPFAATKVSKGVFEASTDIKPGAIIKDLGDDAVWFVMSSQKQITGGEVVYHDATLYIVSGYCFIRRFVESAKDWTGRDSDPSLLNVAWADPLTKLVPLAVPVMVNPQAYNTVFQQESIQESNKIRVVLQSKYGVIANDRLVDADGDCFIVENVDKSTLGHNGLHVLWCDKDNR